MLQGAIAGLGAGSVYAIVAVCLVIMSRLIRVVNFSQTAIGMLGSFTAVALTGAGLPLWLATVVGIVLGGILSGAIGVILAIWLPESPTSARSAVTVAALLTLIALSFILFGNKPLPFQPLLRGVALRIGGVGISQVAVVLLVLSVAIAVGAHLLLTRTGIGLRLRALSERPTTAELVGIRINRLSIGTWIVTGVIATFVVSVIAPTQSNDAVSLSTLVIPGTAAALAGGFQRLDLAVIGGLALGVLDGLLSIDTGLVYLRIFLPLVAIVVLLVALQRREVWDAAR